ncbi:DUF5696 domain-containing protein [Paenibacillus lignilyticus]|uniref:Uncharacterized protein n=1 Tax=Paenibacillus lignilyticus TaxID=1172615 RepID=A0ABS5CI88_9BACL|nr:hypothetical protein [Paenibacillus lignilyticus]
MRNYKWIKRLLSLGLIAACVAFFAHLYMGGSSKEQEDTASPEVLAAAFPDKPAAQSPLSSDYMQVAENEQLILKLKEDTLGIQVVNKRSGYVWASDIAKPDANELWLNFIHSAISIDYFNKADNNPIRTDLTSQTNKSVRVKPIDQGFQATIRFNDLKIGMDLVVKLEGSQVVVNVPQKSIIEGADSKLASLFLYPFLGATKGGDIDGYMFIPDGSGALIKYADNKGKYKTQYETKIYGANNGVEIARVADNLKDGAKEPYTAQFPVFGMVHGEGQHAMLGIVENGRYNAKILGYANGVNTPYNWATAQFLIRESYLQPTSRTMGGIVVYEKNRNPEDMRLRYSFLEGEDAGYIGMANDYRNYLIKQGAFPAEPQPAAENDIPIHLDVLGAETEKGLFVNGIIPMTTAAQLESMVDELHTEGVKRPSVVYKGWNKGGVSGTNPAPVSFESALGSAADFAGLNDRIAELGGKLYYYADFTTAYKESKHFSARAGAARKLDKSLLTLPTYQEVYPSMYYMSADYAQQVVRDNLGKYSKKGIGSVAVDITPFELFSERVDSTVSSRSQTAAAYDKLMGMLKPAMTSMAMYQPNDYMLRYADELLNIPMHSSQYTYTSEEVPFEQIVLKGYRNYFAEPINFFANPRKEVLKMIETGSYPSYYLTSEPSFRLMHTNSSDVYASSFADWKENIVSTYKMVNDALKPVQYATMKKREWLTDGVVQVTYSNGKALIVNYNGQSYDSKNGSVPALGFKVMEVNP